MIGTICYSHSRGLGHLAKSFIDAGVIDDIYVVKHPGVPMRDWYPIAPIVDIREVGKIDRDWVKQYDAMLFFETPFDWNLIDFCNRSGIRTYLVTMYECTPNVIPFQPRKYLCPSLLDLQEFPNDSQLVSIPVEVPWKLRSNALHFVHNGGYLGMRGREGTELLIESMSFVKSPIRLTIRVQENVSQKHQLMCAKDKRIDYIAKSVPYGELYAEGDVSILPQKFNGMSMPLLESRASGMLVMTTDRFPTREWLDGEGYLIPTQGEHPVRLSPRFRVIQESIISPVDIAREIDSTYGHDISMMSKAGLKWGKSNNWESLLPKWKEIISC